MPGSRSKTVVGGAPSNCGTFRFGGVCGDRGASRMIHRAPSGTTSGVGETTNVKPCGAAPLCTARTDRSRDTDPKDASENRESAHAVNAYSAPSGRPENTAVPSESGTHVRSARETPSRTVEPSPPDAAVATARTVEVPSPSDVEVRERANPVGAPIPLARIDTAAPEVVPARPGGRGKRVSGVTTTVVAVFDPTRNAGTESDVREFGTASSTVSPAALAIWMDPVLAWSIPSMLRLISPPSPPVTTGAHDTDSGAAGGSYAQASVRTLARDSPTALTATTS